MKSLNRWRCETCETLNELGESKCIVCDSKRNGVSKDRWRCKFCETLNVSDVSKCVVCDSDKNLEIKKRPTNIAPSKQIKKCAFRGCESTAIEGKPYCDYHHHALCPECLTAIKAAGMDYCIDCGMTIVEKYTKGLRRTKTVLKVVNIALTSTFTILLLSYLFYFN